MAKEKNFTRGARIRSGGQTGVDRAALDAAVLTGQPYEGCRDQGGLFSYLSPEARVPAKHPLRQVRELVRAVLNDLSPSFGKLYSSAGRPSIRLGT